MGLKDQRRGLLKSLSKAWVVQRLKHIDLSAVPSWLAPRVSTASRYKHSLGVGRLSLLVSDGSEHDLLLLTAAAVLHDVGNGPFPHISDPVMEDLLGFSHEAALGFAFEESPSKDTPILNEYSLDLDEVASVVQGKHRLSSLLDGRPDLDNADNVHRFMMTIPGKPLGEASYRPWEIADALSIENGVAKIPADLRQRWLDDWEKVYSHLWNDELNMVCWTMLGRAMRILKEQLTSQFFTLNNREAFHLIRLKLPELANGLAKKTYRLILDERYRVLRGEARKLSNLTGLRSVEDELCRETASENWSLGITADKPFIRKRVEYWRVYLVTYGWDEKTAKLQRLLDEMLSSSTPFNDSRNL